MKGINIKNLFIGRRCQGKLGYQRLFNFSPYWFKYEITPPPVWVTSAVIGQVVPRLSQIQVNGVMYHSCEEIEQIRAAVEK